MKKSAATVGDVIGVMGEIAPPSLAESWDNVGLQVGDRSWKVERVRVALDPLETVVRGACEDRVDMLITHHPLIFRPLKQLDFGTPVGRIVRACLESGLAVFSAHTNLDSARGGINDYLCDLFELHGTEPLQRAPGPEMCKLVVFVPKDSQEKILAALHESGAGKIGAYDCCTFRCEGVGTFRPGVGTAPFAGSPGQLSEVEEVRVETVISRSDAAKIVERLRAVHPYETMAFDLYNVSGIEWSGLGRTGRLREPVELERFAAMAKRKLGLSHVKVAGDPKLEVEKVAVCSGSGSGLMKNFVSSGAQVYVSGDLHYHDARDAEALHRGLVDIGHFGSEHVVTEFLVESLRTALERKNLDVSVEACEAEKDPFRVL